MDTVSEYKIHAAKSLHGDTNEIEEITDIRSRGVLDSIVSAGKAYDQIKSVFGAVSTSIRYSKLPCEDSKDFLLMFRTSEDNVMVHVFIGERVVFCVKDKAHLRIIEDMFKEYMVPKKAILNVHKYPLPLSIAHDLTWAIVYGKGNDTYVDGSSLGARAYTVHASMLKKEMKLSFTPFDEFEDSELPIEKAYVPYEQVAITYLLLSGADNTVQIDKTLIGVFSNLVVFLRKRNNYTIVEEEGVTTYRKEVKFSSTKIVYEMIVIDQLHSILLKIKNLDGSLFDEQWALCSVHQKFCYSGAYHDLREYVTILMDSTVEGEALLPSDLVPMVYQYESRVYGKTTEFDKQLIQDVFDIVKRHVSQKEIDAIRDDIFQVHNILLPNKEKK